MMKFVDPKNDLAFKKIFASEEHKDILISFLNAALDFKEEREIADLKVLSPYQAPRIEELKETVLDIQAKDKAGNEFIIEMQKNNKGDFAKRSLYYTSKAYISQLDQSQNYRELKKVYFIGILNFDIFESKNYLSRHLICNLETQKSEIKDFSFTFIELKKFNKELKDLENIIDKWTYFLKHAGDLELVPESLSESAEISKAFKAANSFGWSKEELRKYDYLKLKEVDAVNEIETALNQGLQIGIEKGRNQGRKEGIDQGRKEGIDQGLKEGKLQEKRNLVINLAKANSSPEFISEVTGLNLEQVSKILREKSDFT